MTSLAARLLPGWRHGLGGRRAWGLFLASVLGAVVWPGVSFAQVAVAPSDPLAGSAWQVSISDGDAEEPILAVPGPTRLWGATDAPIGATVAVTLTGVTLTTEVDARGQWSLLWEQSLPFGSHTVEVVITTADGRRGSASREIVVGRLPRRPPTGASPDRAAPERLRPEDFQESTDRWRITPPPYELNAKPGRWDPYNQNVLKGDFPIRGNDLFLVLTGTSDTLVEARSLPTPAGVSTADTTISFFGGQDQIFSTQTLLVSADLYRGDTAFRPVDWRVKGTLAGNLNYLATDVTGAVNPDVRDGRTRTDGRLTIEELFFEKKLRDLSPNYDFLSVRVGVQPFTSDFRGFLYSDINLGVRLFGNFDANRWQFNLAYFEQLEKNTNSGLNTFHLRDQSVLIANLYRQDFPWPGHTAQVSIHHLRDGPSFHFDDNGFLARPDPVGDFTEHQVEATYLGFAGAGHLGRVNLDSVLFFVTGNDSLNPIAGRELVLDRGEFRFRESVDIEAYFAAVEISYDRDWLRGKFALLYASGDDDLHDRDAGGFDAIFDRPNFAGGGFSFWNRMAIRLAGTGVTLVNRGSLLPDLRTSREEGQVNFVNPGLRLASVGVDAKLTTKLEALATLNYLTFDHTAVLEGLLFQAPLDREIGWDLSLGARYRPFLNQNMIVQAGVAGFLPGRGFEEIFEEDDVLYQAFGSVVLTF
jgi:hypothetical protein